MPLVKITLAASLKSAFLENLQQPDADSDARQKAEQAAEKLANTFANAIDTFVKSGTVSFTAGTVTGATPANGTLQGGAASGGIIS